MKVSITGASNFVNRMFEACGNYQWAREFLKNSLEAKADKVEFGIEWQAVEKHGVYRRTVIDNGEGMDRDDLLKFFSTLGEGAKKIGGVHENFGVGAKIASLPWNPEGVVVVSYKGGQCSMIWIMLEPDSGDYELVEFEVDGKKTCVIDPSQVGEIEGVNWGQLRPDWVKDHGTIIVLIGKETYPDTIMGNPEAGERDIKGLSVYLNTRFWDLSHVDVRVVELRSEKKAQWPQGPDEKDDSRRENKRRAMGARHYLTDIKTQGGALSANGKIEVDDARVVAEWYLWKGERPAVHSYAKKGGYIAVRYKDELFELSSSKAHFRWFGIIEGEVQQNLTIILEPAHYQAENGRWGVHPDQSRNRLIFTGNGEKGVTLPLSDWGTEFAHNLPEPVLDAIHEARSGLEGTIEDDEYRKRLQDKFGDRWTIKRLVKAKKGERDARPATSTNEDVEVLIDIITSDNENEGETHRRRRRKTFKIIRKQATEGGTEEGVIREAPVDVPKYDFARATSFEKPWHLAAWAPKDPKGPTVKINIESPILQEVVKYHQQQYPDVYAEQVTRTVQEVFGEVAVSKVAHSEKLSRSIPSEELDRDYRNEQALTIALMGLMAEESLISQRLGRLGRKKTSAAPA